MVVMMRITCLTICCLTLSVGSGCQSGAVGFRNPFRNPFVKAVPEPSADLVAKAVEEKESSDVVDVAQQEVPQEDLNSDPPATASVKPIPDSLGQSDRDDNQPMSEIDRLLTRADQAYQSELLTNSAAFYDEVVRLDPENVHAHHRLAIIADRQKNYPLAESHYIAALNIQPENTNLLNDLGYSYYLQKKFQDSEAYLKYVLEQNPGNTLAMKNLGLVYAAQGNSQQAYALFQRGGLSPGEIQKQMQVAAAHAGQAPSSQSSRGVASTANPRGTASTGVQPVGGEASMNQRGNSATPANFSQESPQNQYPPMSPNSPVPSHNSQKFQGTDPRWAENPTYPQQSNYSPSNSSNTRSGPSNFELERAALNTGFGNLFPMTSPQEHHRAHQTRPVSWEHEGLSPEAAQHAYHEQFGDQRMTGSHVERAHYQGQGVPAIPASSSGMNHDVSPESNQFGSQNQRPQSNGNNRYASPISHGSASANIQTPPSYDQFPQQPPSRPAFQSESQSNYPGSQPPFSDPYTPEQTLNNGPQNALREYQQGIRNEQSAPFSPSTYR